MVKDERTGLKVSDVQEVMDGDLDEFIEAFLKSQATGGGRQAAVAGGKQAAETR
jgi:protein subunit release factor A